MQIGIEGIRLSFPLDLVVQGVEVVSAEADTLVTLERLSLRINPAPLWHQVVAVDALTLKDVAFNSGSLLEGMAAEGRIAQLAVQADRINLAEEEVTLNSALLSDADIFLRIDSIAPADTTASEPLNWLLMLEKIALNRLSFALQMPQDSLSVATRIEQVGLRDGKIDLGLSRYEIAQFSLQMDTLRYDGNEQQSMEGLDPMHLLLSNLTASVDSILYHEKEIRATLSDLTLEERSGLAVTSLRGSLNSDSLTISIPQMKLTTPASDLTLFATIPWSLLEEEKTNDKMRALLSVSLGKGDIFTLVPDLPEELQISYPEQPLLLQAGVEGNFSILQLRQLSLSLPDAFEMDARGTLRELTDSVRLGADITLEAKSYDLAFLLDYLPREQREQFNIPEGVALTGEVTVADQTYHANLQVTDQSAQIHLDADYQQVSDSYMVEVKIDSLLPIRYMPQDSILHLTAALRAEGRGFDPFAASTLAEVKGELTRLQYGTLAVEGVTLAASLKENKANLNLKGDSPFLKLDVMFDGTVKEELIAGMLIVDAEKVDLYQMQLMEEPFSTSFQLFSEFNTNLREQNALDVSLGNWELVTAEGRHKPKMLTLKARSDKEATSLSLHAGDLGITLTGNDDWVTLTDKLSLFSAELDKQLAEDSSINIAALRPVLPDMTLAVSAAKDNPLYNLLTQANVGFNRLALDVSTSPERGVWGDMEVFAAHQDTFLIDSITLAIRPDTAGLRYRADVVKRRYRQQQPFNASLIGELRTRYVNAELTFENHHNETGILLGVEGTKTDEGIEVRFYPEDPIIAFNQFALNEDNYIRIKSMKDIEADVRLTGVNNAFFWLHSMETGDDYPELHVELGQIDLKTATQGFAQFPNLAGMLNADIRYAPMEETFMVVVDANVDELFYEKGRVGEMMFNLVYLPLDNNQHQVDAHFYHDREERGVATIFYEGGKQDRVEGNLNILALPLTMVNPFIPDDMARLSGAMNVAMDVTGSSSDPKLNGYLQMDTSAMYIGMAGTELRLDEKRVTIKNSSIHFNKYNIYASGQNPFVIDGNVDISDMSQMMADLRLSANNMQLLDAKRNNESLVYGKLFINMSTTVKGPLDALNVRGNVQLLGGTDLTYILTESPLTVQDRLKDLVTFTSFTDTLTRIRRRPQSIASNIGGMDMLMVIRIDPVVQVRVDLTPDRSSYVELEGGGDLSFQYSSQGDMVLNGRYTLTEGNVKYALPVIPLKEFHVKEGSYVQWDGDPFNPQMNISATERMRATVSSGGGQRSVNFDVGIQVQERLENMALSFIIEAPEDMTVQNDLTALGADERSKRAVGMMVTGLYLDGSNGAAGINMGDALSSFLASEINNIAGEALQSVDISFGVDQYDQSAEMGGGQRTDYSFRFAKRFYNDRIRVVIGGRVSTGDVQQEQQFIDNVSLEYRLDNAGSRVVKLFHDRNYESLLEGEVIETGAGIVLRKKMLHLRELFDFRKTKSTPEPEDESEEREEDENKTVLEAGE